jgi:hypothetical protein
MKLTNDDVANLHKILTVCDLVNIGSIVIENGKVSGINEDRSAMILSNNNIPVLEDDIKLGLTRLKLLKSRLDIFNNDTNLNISLDTKANNETSQLNIKGKSSSVKFRATSPTQIKYPKGINDTPLKELTISRAEAMLILNAGKSMDAANIAINIKKDNSVIVEFSDLNQDTFTIALEEPATSVSDEDGDSQVNYYIFKMFSSLVKAAFAEDGIESINLIIGSSATQIFVYGHAMRLLAQTSA